MLLRTTLILALGVSPGFAQPALKDRAVEYLRDLIRLDTVNPPGNETRAAEYLKKIADANGIPCELIGPDPKRQNFIARLKGSGKQRPLLLMAHSDVVPFDRSLWSADPLGAEVRNGFIYGRGAEDVKSLLAAEMAVLVELKRRGVRLDRDIILLSESDEEAGSSSIIWLIENHFTKIDADFALNEMGSAFDTNAGERVFQIQTSEKVPTRVQLTATGAAGHGSLPRDDNPVVHLARAITRLADADQPVRLNTTTRTYFRELAKLQDYAWLRPYLPRLERPADSEAAANEIRSRDPELNAMLRTSISPTMLTGSVKINVIPNTAEGQVDIRRLPTETRDEVHARLQRIINDPAVRLDPIGVPREGTEPSSLTTPLFLSMSKVFRESHPRAVVVPWMMRATTDGGFLRAKGMAVYGVPIFRKEGELRWHGNDERISIGNVQEGTELLMKIVLEVAAAR